MGNSALKSHLETSQKTGVFQLTEKGLQEVRGLLLWAETDGIVAACLSRPSEHVAWVQIKPAGFSGTITIVTILLPT